MNRRTFLAKGCALCTAVTVGGAAVLLQSCAPLPTFETRIEYGMITVPVAAFGSTDRLLVNAAAFPYSIALVKDGPAGMLALLLRCTHADAQLAPEARGYSCRMHGSKFTAQGSVTRGPAARDLERLRTEVRDAHVYIHIPERTM
ncbi:MAG: Rieske 2Fe-2S domain-containing protein [Ignavibacteria bacterium]|nr:Rieske 2Fe-2S domain-containing protein [Ignavibacteria bacterium]